jgi:cytoskeletal protein RodZ
LDGRVRVYEKKKKKKKKKNLKEKKKKKKIEKRKEKKTYGLPSRFILCLFYVFVIFHSLA